MKNIKKMRILTYLIYKILEQCVIFAITYSQKATNYNFPKKVVNVDILIQPI